MANKSLILIQQENLELKKENTSLKETVTKLLEEIDRLRSVNLPANPQKITLTTEQKIIEEQIQAFQVMSASRTLDIDDIRALDLLIKNKRLLDANKPIEPEYEDLTKNQSNDDLLRLAGNVEYKQPKKPNKSEASKKDSVE
jgi:hypothetical protein